MKKKTAKKEEPQIELLGTFQVKVYETPGLYMRQPVLEGTLGDKKFSYDNIIPTGHLFTVDGRQYVVPVEAMVRALFGVHEEFERIKKNESLLKSGDGDD